ncbi:MAG: alpha/beta hydrolase [Acidobacteriota bacterium]
MPKESPSTARAKPLDLARIVSAAAFRALRRVFARLFGRTRHRAWGLRFDCTIAATRGAWSMMRRLGLPRWRAASEAMSPRNTDGLEPRSADLEDLEAVWLEPPDAEAGTLLYLHGGGYVFGSLRSHGRLIGGLARAIGCRALALDYRLAPENTYPAALEDSLSAYRQLLASGARPEQTVLAGDSAGGNLVLATLLALRDAGDPLPSAAVLLSPWVDLSNSGKSFEEHAGFDYVGRDHCDLAASLYLAGQDPRAPEASPLYADLSGLPPLLIHAGALETLRDQIRDFASAAKTAGTEVEYVEEPDMVHVWHLFRGLTPKATKSIAEIGEFVRERWSRAQAASRPDGGR